MSLKPKTIAIDGTAAAGKSTLGRALAEHLDYLYFDTGVMYRAVTLAALRQGIPVEDEQRVTRLAEQLAIDVRPPTQPDGRPCDVLLDGQDVTWAIRSAEVDGQVSQVSVYRGVRRAMSSRQREIGLRGEVVMVGRDIGTVVLPEADLKIYLDATVDARAQRRHQEGLARGDQPVYEQVLDSVRQRDRIDSTRAVAPLKPAEDAIILDTTRLSAQQVLESALALIEAA
ncbi:MAG TPA: (d)CMP kinase [Anaerolineales bacterium]